MIIVSQDERDRQNRLAIRYFAIAGVPIAVANAFVQSVIQNIDILTPKNLALLAYFVLLLVFERFFLPKQTRNSTFLVYAVEAPVMIISILLGTVWDPTHQAITFPMFMSIIPIFILDMPWRMGCVTAAWNVVFLALVATTKDPSMLHPDLAHALEFYLLSLAVTTIVIRLRNEVVYNLDRANYHLEHDVLTNTRNRLSLETHVSDYVGQQLFVAMGVVDHLDLINDFYGKESGDEVLGTFAHVAKEVFGTEAVFRYSGDDLLCLWPNSDEDSGTACIERCRQLMLDAHFDKVHIPVTLSFGYVMGVPTNAEQFAGMIQLANIYEHQAERKGESTSVGGEFTDEALHEGISQANVGHASSYETNKLTGLPTVPYFVVHAEETLLHVVDLSRHPVIGYINIERFRAFNDKYGYARGDELIRTLAQLLQTALPSRHIAYVTGSKFALMCYMEEIEPTMAYVQEGLANYLSEATIRARAGFVEYHTGERVISLMDKARMAQRNVDDRQKASFRLYDTQLDEELRLRQYLVDHLDEAIQKDWLKVYYQPIMWSPNGRLSSFEALSRWVDPVYGMLPPGQFIGALEREHLIYKLSLHVIRQAMVDLKAMQERGLPLTPVSVNLSRNDFFACDMVEEIARIVEEAGFEPYVLSIEITESAFAENPELLKHEVERFHERGFAVWMDDFGSEYSTLNLLEELDFDLVKLDMRFMRHFTNEGRNVVIVSSIIEMCERLGMATLVEGVEEAYQLDLLRDMGCDKLQGFYFSRPLPLDEVVDLAIARAWV